MASFLLTDGGRKSEHLPWQIVPRFFTHGLSSSWQMQLRIHSQKRGLSSSVAYFCFWVSDLEDIIDFIVTDLSMSREERRRKDWLFPESAGDLTN